MASELSPEQVGILVSLLLMVVQQLAALVRDAGDDRPDYADTHPLLDPVRTDGGKPAIFALPRLGRLNVLHTTNVIVLAGAFLILAAAEQSIVTNVFALVVAIFWLQLPLIEVPNYQEICGDDEPPVALYLHVAGTVVVIAAITGIGGFEPTLFLQNADIFNPNLGFILADRMHLGASLLVLGLVLLTSFAFLKQFEQELEGEEETTSESKETPAQ